MYKILSGKEPSAALLEELKAKVEKMDKKPHLAIVLVGNDPASEIYVRKKLEKAEAIGVKTTLKKMDESTSQEELLKVVEELNNDPGIHGFIVQAPLPKQIDESKVVEAIDPKKDVDGWTSANMGRMFIGLDAFLPATPAGVMRILDHYKIGLEGKNVTVIGRSNVVGKPLSFLLLQRNATVTICHSRTRDL